MNRQFPRALIVEDEPTLALALSMIFRLWSPGFLSDRVGMVSEAIEHLQDPGLYDLIILDLMLPDQNGVEVLKHIREHKLTVPVAIATGKDIVDMRDVVDLKPDWYFHKPASIYELKHVIDSVTERFREENKE